MLLKMQVHMSTAHAEITGSPRIVCEQVRDMIDFIFAERLGQVRQYCRLLRYKYSRSCGDIGDSLTWNEFFSQCGKTFAHKERLRQHRTMVHVNNMAKQQCQFCGKVCHTLHALYKHKKIHSKTKPWQCSLCDYREAVHNICPIFTLYKTSFTHQNRVIKIFGELQMS